MSAGKKVLVLGGSRGIGRGIVLKLIEHGYDVDYTYNRTQGSEDAIRLHVAQVHSGSIVRCFPCDITRMEDLEKIRTAASDGGRLYHGMVYCAGVAADGLVANIDARASRALMEVNFWGFVQAYTGLYRYLDRGAGRVIAIGSVASRRHSQGNGIYAASKAALAAYIRGIACENGRRGLTANCVEPGYVDTDLLEAYRGRLQELEARIPARRVGTTGEVSGLVAFLLSAAASYINGECISVDGGLSAGF